MRRDQRLARAAWDVVQELPGGAKQKFRSRAQGLPAMLQSSGLAATAAFLKSKSEPDCQLVYGSLASWLRSQFNYREDCDLVTWIASASPTDYRRATAEARAFASWLRRAAEAEIPRGKG